MRISLTVSETGGRERWNGWCVAFMILYHMMLTPKILIQLGYLLICLSSEYGYRGEQKAS
jgi:hypothetical protein